MNTIYVKSWAEMKQKIAVALLISDSVKVRNVAIHRNSNLDFVVLDVMGATVFERLADAIDDIGNKIAADFMSTPEFLALLLKEAVQLADHGSDEEIDVAFGQLVKAFGGSYWRDDRDSWIGYAVGINHILGLFYHERSLAFFARVLGFCFSPGDYDVITHGKLEISNIYYAQFTDDYAGPSIPQELVDRALELAL